MNASLPGSAEGTPSTPPRRARRMIAALMLLAVAASAGGWLLHARLATVYTDADTIHQPQRSAVPREILWQPPTLLPEFSGLDGDQYEPRLSGDGTTLFFVRGKAGGAADIYTSMRTIDGWSAPQPLDDINTSHDDLGPEPAHDGRALYFYSDRPGGFGGYDLWVARRSADGRSGWGAPINLGPSVNSAYNDYGPALTPDGSTLYFSSNRPHPDDVRQPNPDAWPGTLREDLFHRTYDLYAAAIGESGPANAELLSGLNSPFNDGAPAVTPVGDFVYFASDRPGGAGGFDLYRTRRLRGAHTPPENLGPSINTPANELDPGMGLGGYALHFSSDRLPEGVRAEQAAPYRLYQTASREVFRERDALRVDWAAIWRVVGPNLLWALLALILILLLLALLRDLQSRRLSLLARCLLASLLAHLLLLLLFNAWGVTAGIAGEFRRQGAIRVALTGAAADQAAGIVGQVRGVLTDAALPPIEMVAAERLTAQPPIETSDVSAQLDAEHIVTTEQHAALTQPDDAPAQHATELPRVALTAPSAVLTSALATPDESHQAQAAENDGRQQIPTPVMQASRPAPAPIDDAAPAVVALAPASPTAQPAVDRSSAPGEFSVTEARPVETTIFLKNLSAAHGAPVASPLDELVLPESITAQQSTGEVSDIPLTAPAGMQSTQRAPLNAPLDTSAASSTTMLEPAAAQNRPSDAPVVLPSVADAPAGSTAAYTPTQPHKAHATPPGAQLALGELGLPDTQGAPPALASSEASQSSPEPLVALLHLPRATFDVSADPPSTSPIVQLPLVPGTDTFESAAKAAQRSELFQPAAPTDAAPREARFATTFTTETAASTTPQAPDALDLALPLELAPPAPTADEYAQRAAGQRMEVVQQRGGSAETERAVARALQWLAAHQSADGRWDGKNFDESCGGCGGEAEADVSTALTGLSLLCFLAADHTHVKDGPYRDNVTRGLNWLRQRQQSDGDLRGDETMYTQGIATIALAEALGMTADPQLRKPVERAVRFIDAARNRREGGWRYDPGQPGDTSVLGWQVMALRSARTAGVDIPMASLVAARRWLERVESSSQPGHYAYQPGRPITPTMTAEGLFIQQLLGVDRDSPRVENAVRYVMDHSPDWEGGANTYYWYYATLALFQHQGPAWEEWNALLTRELLDHQHDDGAAAGSWDPVGEWAPIAGRVYQTALCTLMLEVYYRYLPMYANPSAEGIIGTIRGRVTDAQSGEPLPGALVHLNLPDGAPASARADTEGRYALDSPAIPDFVAVSASHAGYVPGSANVASASLSGRTLSLNFALQPESAGVVAIEAVPDVHHLGDDRFGGAINSQFQKQSEGRKFSAEFTLAANQLPPHISQATITLLAKGVQSRHRFVINGTELADQLSESPDDGSFGEFAAEVDVSLLRPGVNVLEIIAGARGSDIDDFEFVNVQIRLRL